MRIALVGDYDPSSLTHAAIYAALQHAAVARDRALELCWLETSECQGQASGRLSGCDGVFIASGGPYRSMQGALDAIEFARTHDVPLLGTCAGFQHVVVEYARNVLGRRQAMHAEYDPDASDLFISRLVCSPAGRTMPVQLARGSRAREHYNAAVCEEGYRCNFGIQPERLGELERAGLVFSGHDNDGEARILELPQHRFFLATLFLPQLRSRPTTPHPLFDAYLRAQE
jgi:CTP synthase (UTP-ammonia lyase)